MNQRFIVGMLILGCCLIFIGYKEYTVYKRTTPTLTFLDLSKYEKGFVDLENNYIKIGRHLRVYPYSIYMYKSNQDDGNKKTRVRYAFFPILSMDNPKTISILNLIEKFGSYENIPEELIPIIDSPLAFLKSEKFVDVEDIPSNVEIKNEAEGILFQPELTSDGKSFMRTMYPNLNPPRTIFIDEDRKPFGQIRLYIIFGLGGSFLVISIGTLCFGRIKDEYI